LFARKSFLNTTERSCAMVCNYNYWRILAEKRRIRNRERDDIGF
jgi:hypothetical protein